MIKNIVKTTIISLTLMSSLSASSNNDYFIGVSAGLSQLTTSQDDISGSIELGTKPDTKGENLTLEVGKRLSSYSFTTASYSYVKYSDIELHNYLVSYNYQSKNGIYMGMLAGASDFKASKSLMNGNIAENGRAKLALGFQIGYKIEINRSFAFFTQYQILAVNHKVKLQSGTAESELNRDNFSNLNAGFRYSF